MKSYIIDGSDLCTDKISGISRYAFEVLSCIDKLLDDHNIGLTLTVCYPSGRKIVLPHLNNIKVEKLDAGGRPFRTVVLYNYAKKSKTPVCSFGPAYTFSHDSIITLHDIRPIEKKEYDSKGLRRSFKLFLLLCRLFNSRIVTVSNYQKQRIIELGHINEKRITVIGNGWDHILRIAPDYSIFRKYTNIHPYEYFYALGSVAKHKNYKWIYEVAKRNPSCQFVVAGNISKEKWDTDNEDYSRNNIIYTGFVTDEENVALMKNCKAFLHPSKYEGFGIPPMEAIGLGKKAIISNSTCLPEIYDGFVSFFDPDDYDVDLEDLINQQHKDPNTLLNKYLWQNAATKWIELLCR